VLKSSLKIEAKETALSSATPRRRFFTPWYLGLALAAATFLLYAPSGAFRFVNFDDGEFASTPCWTRNLPRRCRS
jgi:hypothetical protein